MATHPQLSDSEKLFLSAIVQSSDDAIIGKTLDGIVTSWNPAAERLYGYPASEMIGQPVTRLGYADQEHEFQEIMESVANGHTVRLTQAKRLNKGGREIDVSLIVSPVWNENGELIGATTIARDVTAGIKLEEQFLRSQKMEAFGLLAGGVAHDCNNLLMLLGTYIYLLRQKRHEPLQVDRYADLIEGTLKKTESIIRQLLAFGRQRPRQLTFTSLNVIAAGVAEMLVHLRGDNIVISTNLNSSGTVRVDIPEIEQLVMNLAINARDAMPKGGNLAIETSDVFWAEFKKVNGTDIPPGRYQVLAVSDTGIGMDHETRTRMFEPFFSTKPAGKGTGLGLSTVRAIAKRHGAHVIVGSEIDKGTCIKVYFPEA